MVDWASGQIYHQLEVSIDIVYSLVDLRGKHSPNYML